MRKPNLTVAAFVAALMAVSGATALAENFNPQPDPPGRNHAYEPPDPCKQSQMTGMQAHGSGGGAGKIRMRKAGGEQSPMMRKAGGEQIGVNGNIHCLNPQPLPPG